MRYVQSAQNNQNIHILNIKIDAVLMFPIRITKVFRPMKLKVVPC